MPPGPMSDPGAFTHLVVVLAVVLSVAVLLGMGKMDATSATPLFGAALGVGGLANVRRQPPNGN